MGGFRPGLRRESLGIGPDFEFLASEHGMYVRGGITVDAASVGLDADGNKILRAGTVMGKVTSTGKYIAYLNGASDGSQTAKGFLVQSINLKDGDVITSILMHGSVIETRTSGVDSAAKTDFAGAIIFQ